MLVHHINSLREHLWIKNIANALLPIHKAVIFCSNSYSCYIFAFHGHQLSFVPIFTGISQFGTEIRAAQIKFLPSFLIYDSLVKLSWTASSAHSFSKEVRLEFFHLRWMSGQPCELRLRLIHDGLTIPREDRPIHVDRR